jgi:hypothetical protein
VVVGGGSIFADSRDTHRLTEACELVLRLLRVVCACAGVPRLFDLVNVSDSKLRLAFW